MSDGSEPRQRIHAFTDLRAWQEAHTLVLRVYELTAALPAEERYGLSSQMRRAALSVSSNIAEGFGRNSARDKQHFYTMSRTSLAETQNQLLVARDLSYIASDIFDAVFAHTDVVDKLITGLEKSATTRGH